MRSQILSVASYLKLLFRECTIQANCLVILAATFFIFIIDLQLPLGVVAGVLYALVVLASLWVNGGQFTYLIAVLGFLFTLMGFFVSPSIVIPMDVVFINFGLTILLIICTAIMVVRIKKANFDMSALMNRTLTDPMSGHKNRDAFEIELNIEILRCNRYHRNLSVSDR